MNELSFRNSLYISIAIHFVLFLLLSLFFVKNPLRQIETPTVVNIEFNESDLSANIGGVLPEPAKANTPALPERKTESLKSTVVPEKTTPIRKVKEAPEKSREKIIEKVEKAKLTSEKVKKLVKEKIEKETEDVSRKIKEEELKEEIKKKKLQEELDEREGKELLQNIDKLLEDRESREGSAENTGRKSEGNDPLSGGKWSSKARQTIFFPDIQSKIPPELRKKGVGYSVTAKIKFDKNGLPIYVEIIKSSGNSVVDRIFNSELKKIRVEPVDKDVVDEVVHTFRIYVK